MEVFGLGVVRIRIGEVISVARPEGHHPLWDVMSLQDLKCENRWQLR